jgi:hypothetical protein
MSDKGVDEMGLNWKYAGAAAVAMAVVIGGITVLPARAAGITPPTCTKGGHITYTLARAAKPTADQTSAYAAIDTAMKQAVTFYNCYLTVTKAISVSYDPGVPTAQGSYNGTLKFGARNTMQQITAMHETSHVLGVGTVAGWATHVSGGNWTGPAAIAALKSATGNQAAVLHADGQHFWPYGLNQTSEVTGSQDLIRHCLLVEAMRKDMGL